MHVQIGGLTFYLHDTASFESVSGAFLHATELGARSTLPASTGGRWGSSTGAGRSWRSEREYLFT